MRRKKESRPSGYDTRAAAEMAAFGRAAISYDDCTTTAAGRQIQIKDFLLRQVLYCKWTVGAHVRLSKSINRGQALGSRKKKGRRQV